jgi:hypothetical protein
MRFCASTGPVETPVTWKFKHLVLPGREMGLGESGDGYDRMDSVMDRGWHAVSAWGRDGWDLGDWPLVMYFVRNRSGVFTWSKSVQGHSALGRSRLEANVTRSQTRSPRRSGGERTSPRASMTTLVAAHSPGSA